MKKLLITLCLGFCSFNLGLAKESLDESPKAQVYTLYTQSQLDRFSFPLKVSIQELVQMLRDDLGMRVHFENECLSEEDACTAKDIVERYTSLGSLSEKEKFLLESAKKLVDSNKGYVVIDYPKQYLSLEPEDLLDSSTLIKKIEATNLYIVEHFNDGIIVYPKNVSYENVESFAGDFESFGDVRRKLDDLLRERNLYYFVVTNNPPKNYDFKVDVKGENFRIFLSKFAEKLGRDYVWNISGYEKGRRLSFNSLASRRQKEVSSSSRFVGHKRYFWNDLSYAQPKENNKGKTKIFTAN